jgi:TolB-like protein/Flp pilus assembly protein TadD
MSHPVVRGTSGDLTPPGGAGENQGTRTAVETRLGTKEVEPFSHPPRQGQPGAVRLDSWKEIAGHLRRDKRTVQRWERLEGLPIHRHLHQKRGSVFAYTAELDAWLETRRHSLEAPEWDADRRAGGLAGRRGLLTAVLVVALALAGWGLSRWRAPDHAAAPRSIGSLAVLPLQNLTGDADQEYLADGMTEALIADLARHGSLRVISRTSAMRYKGTRRPLPEIARELDVDAVVEGAVMRSGGRVRVTAQLIHAATDSHLWSQTFDRDLDDILSLQREIASAIAAEIPIAATPAETPRPSTGRPVDAEAYQAYLKGRYFWNRRTVEGFQKAIDHFHQAIDRAPDHAPSYAGLADSYVLLGSMSETPLARHEATSRARQAASKALALDETLAEAHTSLGFVLMQYDWDWRGAEKRFRRAIELNPGYATAHHWYAYDLAVTGRMEEALESIRRAQKLDPLSLIINTDVAELYCFAGRYDLAVEQGRRTLEMDPEFLLARRVLAWAQLGLGRADEAIAGLQAAVAASGDDRADLLGSLGYAHARAGHADEARHVLATLGALSKRAAPPAHELALIHGALGERDRAFEWLEKAYGERSPFMMLIGVFPLMEPLRTDPRFDDLVRRAGLPRSDSCASTNEDVGPGRPR